MVHPRNIAICCEGRCVCAKREVLEEIEKISTTTGYGPRATPACAHHQQRERERGRGAVGAPRQVGPVRRWVPEKRELGRWRAEQQAAPRASDRATRPRPGPVGAARRRSPGSAVRRHARRDDQTRAKIKKNLLFFARLANSTPPLWLGVETSRAELATN